MRRRNLPIEKNLSIRGIITTILIFNISLVCLIVNRANAETDHEITATRPLIFLGNQSLPPMCYIKNDEPAGVVVDLVNAVTKRMDRRVEIRLMNWSEAQKQVLDDRADALFQINSNPDRLQIYDFSEPLLASEFTIFTTVQRQGIVSMADLRGLRVGVEEKGLPILLLRQDSQISIKIISDFAKGFEMITSGELDAVIADSWVGSYVIAEKGIRDVKLIDSPISKSYSAIAVKKGNRALLDEINKALVGIKEDGTYDRIVHSWQSKEIVFKTREQLHQDTWVFATITALLAVSLSGVTLLIRENQRRKKVETMLRASEERFQCFMDNNPAIAWMKDEEGRYIYLSKAFINRFEVSLEEWIGKNAYEIWPAADAEGFHQNDMAVLAEGRSTQIVEEAPNPDGSKSCWLSNKFTFSDKAGNRFIAGFGIDISEQIHTELELRESRARFMLLSNTAGLLLEAEDPLKVIHDVAYDVMTQLDCQVFFNFVLDDAMGKPRLNAYAGISEEESRQIALLDWGEAICGCVARDGAPVISENIRVGCDPEATFIRSCGIDAYACFPLMAGGRVIGTLSFGTRTRNQFSPENLDLMKTIVDQVAVAMERKKLVEAMQESEEQFRSIFDNSLDGILFTAPDGTIFAANAAACGILGWTEQELRERGRSIVADMSDPRLQPALEERMRTGRFRGELNYIRKDGSTIPVDVSSSMFLFRHGEKRAGIIFRDITERKQAEETLLRMKYLLSEGQRIAHVGTFEYIVDTLEMDWSDEEYRIYGFEPGGVSPAYDEMLAKCIHPDDAEPLHRSFSAALQKGSIYELEHRIVRPDGSVRWVYDVAHPYFDDTGKLIRYIGTTLDITESKNAEKEKAEFESRLLQMQKMEAVGNLAGGIAHDLNNILYPITGLSEILLEEIPKDTQYYEYAERILNSAIRGGDLVKQILAYSRQSNPQKMPVKIQTILKEALNFIRSAITQHVDITIRIDNSCGMVNADPTQIYQIIINLIMNAFHAIEGKSGIIDVALTEMFFDDSNLSINSMKHGKYACITVSDTGTGIDPALIHRIFEPYFTTKAIGKGTGLGLSVVYGIVNDHGGDIQIQSEIGKGTTFNVYLPILKGGTEKKSHDLPATYPTGNESILLVDDEVQIVTLIKMVLEKLGYQITARTSSPDALDTFIENPMKFDLVISDRGMPVMTGEQLARKLISIRRDIPIILCTGYSEETDEKHATEMGIKGFLKKPVPKKDIAETVRKVLDESKGLS